MMLKNIGDVGVEYLIMVFNLSAESLIDRERVELS